MRMIITKEVRSPRRTEQRRMVLGALKTMQGTPTTEAVWKRVRTVLPGIGLATVYRNLKALKERGEIVEVAPSGDQRFAGFLVQRGEFRCQRCGETVERAHVDLSVDGIAPPGARTLGFQVSVTGLCARCVAEVSA